MFRKFMRRLRRKDPGPQPLARLPALDRAKGTSAEWLHAIESIDTLRRECAERLGLGTGGDFESSGEGGALRYLAGHLPDAPIVFDVGANRGEYTCLLASHLSTAAIYSFEPSPRTFARMQERVAHLGQVRPFNCGLSSADSETMLFSDADGSGLASVHKRRLDHFGITFSQSEAVSMRTFDGFCDEHAVDRVDFLKLDVEGHELEVLKGASRRLQADRVSAIQFEFGGCNIDSRTFFQDFYYLLSDRYHLCRILREGLYRVDRYRESDEVFITTNYLALHKQRFPGIRDTPVVLY